MSAVSRLARIRISIRLSGILTNKVVAHTQQELDQREFDIAAAVVVELQMKPIPATFDEDHRRAIHRRVRSIPRVLLEVAAVGDIPASGADVGDTLVERELDETCVPKFAGQLQCDGTTARVVDP